MDCPHSRVSTSVSFDVPTLLARIGALVLINEELEAECGRLRARVAELEASE